MKTKTLAACSVAGLATGPRSFTGLAAVVFATPPDARSQPDKALAHPATKTAIGLLALQEWVLDKLPKTPSRLETLGLITRPTGAAAAGAILARRAQIAETAATIDEDATVSGPQATIAPSDWKAVGLGAATGAGVALAVAVLGVRLRSGFQNLFGGRDWPAAGLEDLSSAGLAAAAVYLSSQV